MNGNGNENLPMGTPGRGEPVDANAFMEQDLKRVLRVVSGDVIISWDLYEYMYGPQRVTFAEFRWMARNVKCSVPANLLGPDQDIVQGMATVRQYFGEKFCPTTHYPAGIFATSQEEEKIEKLKKIAASAIYWEDLDEEESYFENVRHNGATARNKLNPHQVVSMLIAIKSGHLRGSDWINWKKVLCDSGLGDEDWTIKALKSKYEQLCEDKIFTLSEFKEYWDHRNCYSFHDATNYDEEFEEVDDIARVVAEMPLMLSKTVNVSLGTHSVTAEAGTTNSNRVAHGNERVYEGKLAKIWAISDEQWKQIVRADLFKNEPLVTLDPQLWKLLFEEENGPIDLNGDLIKQGFFGRVVPRIRHEFGRTGKKFRLELTIEEDADLSLQSDVLTVIMYALKELSSEGVVQAINKLLDDNVLSSRMHDPLSFWASKFMDWIRGPFGIFKHQSLLIDRKVFADLYSAWFKVPDSYWDA